VSLPTVMSSRHLTHIDSTYPKDLLYLKLNFIHPGIMLGKSSTGNAETSNISYNVDMLCYS